MPDGFLGIPNGNDKELKMAQLSLKHIQKIYDNQVHVVKDFNLEIEDKEFIDDAPHDCRAGGDLRR